MTIDNDRTALADNPLRTFNKNVEDPSFFCGGGSVAAITASSAVALTLLVMRLNVDRKKNGEYRAEIEEQIRAAESIQLRLYAAADNDLDVLDALLVAQREMKESGERAPYQEALFDAAMSPYEICTLGYELLGIIQSQLPRASRFTVSDLGAAAALTMGAIQGAILTTDVNVAMLKDEPGMSRDKVQEMDRSAQEIVTRSNETAEHIRMQTVAAINRSKGGRDR